MGEGRGEEQEAGGEGEEKDIRRWIKRWVTGGEGKRVGDEEGRGGGG